jgi:uncharacterized repeat protein (TIGR01451 family)
MRSHRTHTVALRVPPRQRCALERQAARGVAGTLAIVKSLMAWTPRRAALLVAAALLTASFTGEALAQVPATISNSFSPSTIEVGGLSIMTVTVTNPNVTPLTNVQFSNTMPAGLTLITQTGGTCSTLATGGGIFSINPGTGTFSSTSNVLAAGQSCNITVRVRGTAVGLITDTTSTVTSTEAGPGGPASASIQVNAPATTTTLASSVNPSNAGQPVTFTATVAPTGGSGTPTGSVTFTDGGTTLGTVPLSGATAAFTTSSLAAGSHSIAASYSGDAGFSPSTSPALTQTVNQAGTTATPAAAAATTTTLASSANPSNAGQAVTFSATVASSAGTPVGTVTFKDGATVIGTATLAAGVAAFTTSSLVIGAHSITASYDGTSGFAVSTSPVLTQTVQIPPDSVRLRALQVAVTNVESLASGAAFAGAVDDAIADGFAEGGGTLILPRGNGVRINFGADDDGATRRNPRVASQYPI